MKHVTAKVAALVLPTLTLVSACKRDKVPAAEEVCIGYFGSCARFEDGRVACWGGRDPFVFDANAVRLDCAEPRHKQLCIEDSSGRFACWAADEDFADESELSIPPDDMLPMGQWWLGKWWTGGGCGIRPDAMATCWPADHLTSGSPEHLPDYPVGWISFTSPCLILVDAEGALHARYETEGCTTIEVPKTYELPHDAHGLDEVPAGSNWRSVAGGKYHACALDDEGKATCWGLYLHEEGAAPADLRFTELTAGNEATCGITTEGTIHCWGGDRAYDTGTNAWIPDEVPTSSGWVHITMSEDYACAIDVEGQVTCFGNASTVSDILDALDNPVSEPPLESDP